MAIKTVLCPACGAEQAILRENPEDTTMVCVFCGESVELPAFEEGEGLEYSYQDEIPQEKKEELWEPKGDKITASFVLSSEEVGTAFMIAGKVKERKWILYLETVLLAVLGIVMLVFSILGLLKVEGFKHPGLINWFYVVACGAIIPYIWISTKKNKERMIKAATSGNQLTLSIYENLIHVHLEGRDPEEDWQQRFDGSFSVIHQEGLFVLCLNSGKILVIPERSLLDEQIEIVKTRLETKPQGAE